MPANTVSELMMVPIGIQLMLCPPKDEGHMPPVMGGSFLRQLPKGAVCCGIGTAERFQTKAKFLNPFEGDKSGEIAGMMYTRLMATHDIYKANRVCELFSRPCAGNRQHVRQHQPCTLLGGHGCGLRKEKSFVVTSAHIAQIPHEGLTPAHVMIAYAYCSAIV